MTPRPFVNLNEIELMPQSPQKPEAARPGYSTDRFPQLVTRSMRMAMTGRPASSIL